MGFALLQLAGVAAAWIVVLVALGKQSAPAAAKPPPPARSAPALGSTTAVVVPSASPDGPQREPELKASCQIPDRGFGPFARWRSLGDGKGRLLAPQQPGSSLDLLLHFHGAEAARKVLAQQAPHNLAVVGIDAGNGSKAYDQLFQDPQSFKQLLAAASDALAPARVNRLFLSAWSAGYGAIRQILRQAPRRAAGVILLDAVHSDFGPDGAELNRASLRPFEELFVRAQKGQQQVALSHSEIRPPSFASTLQVADHLLQHISARRRYAGLLARHGLRLKTSYREAGLRVEGYTGKNKAAHCAHLRMLGRLLQQQRLKATPVSSPAQAAPPPSSDSPAQIDSGTQAP